MLDLDLLPRESYHKSSYALKDAHGILINLFKCLLVNVFYVQHPDDFAMLTKLSSEFLSSLGNVLPYNHGFAT